MGTRGYPYTGTDSTEQDLRIVALKSAIEIRETGDKIGQTLAVADQCLKFLKGES